MQTAKFHSAHPLIVGVFVSAIAALVSALAPREHGAALVGLVFLAATYFFCLRRGAPHSPDWFGLALGGLFDDAPLSLRRLVRDALESLGVALLAALVFFPPFVVGFVLWFEPTRDFSWARVLTPDAFDGAHLGDLMLGHLLVVALPEEAFFRGYLQSSLDERSPPRRAFLGARLGSALVVTSTLFAVGHFATTPDPARLAVFFPSLVFGFLRARTGGIGAAVVFHTLCNVLSAVLGVGFGFARP